MLGALLSQRSCMFVLEGWLIGSGGLGGIPAVALE